MSNSMYMGPYIYIVDKKDKEIETWMLNLYSLIVLWSIYEMYIVSIQCNSVTLLCSTR